MPVTWCYQGEPGQQFCSTGFPMGCYLPKSGKPKDACVMNVDSHNVYMYVYIFIYFIYLFLACLQQTGYVLHF
jgi:transmembrane 9 superfamily protein 2/4